MRILVVSACFPPAWSWGGQVRSIWNLCRGLAAAGATLRVLTTDADLGGRVVVPEERREDGFPVTTAHLIWARAWRFGLAPGLVTRMRRTLAGTDLCVLQGVFTFPLLVGPALCRRAGVPYVICPRGTLESVSLSEKARKKAIYLSLVERRNIRHAAAIQFASTDERDRSAATTASTPSIVVANPLELSAPQTPDGAAWRRRLGLSSDSVLVGMAGRLHPRKGFEIIVPALARCARSIHLVAFGADEAGYGSEITRMAEAAGVASRVHLVGQLEHPALQSAYASVDLLAMPSLSESYGNAVIEALAQGTEVLTSDRVPAGRYAEERGLGRTVAGASADAWAAALDDWLVRRGAFDRGAASATTRDEFGIETTGRRLLEEYGRLTERRTA